MYITPITNYSFTGDPIRIIAKSRNNKKHPFLYNEVLAITRKERISATFHNNRIDLPAPTKEAIAQLKLLNIKFIPIKNK